ncbi:CsgG/HfaB family protein [Lentisphaerota bacterium WC36G]|nr:CsgG/HfaB family protein [Lentisphaerae bacterium WC36]
MKKILLIIINFLLFLQLFAQQQFKIAVIGDKNNNLTVNVADLVMVDLSEKGFSVLERNDIRKLMNELKLSQTSLSNSKNVLKLGKMLKADILLIVKAQEMVVFDTNLAVRLAQKNISLSVDPEFIKQTVKIILDSCQKLERLKNKQQLLLSSLPTRIVALSPQKKALFNKFYKILKNKLINDQKIIVVEREHANELIFENKIDNSLQNILKSAALGLITGSNSTFNSNNISARFFLKGINMDYFAKIELELDSENINKSAEKFYNMIVKNIQKSAPTNIANLHQQERNHARELLYFYEEWKRAMKTKDYNAALKAINSAYILDETVLKEKLNTEVTMYLGRNNYTSGVINGFPVKDRDFLSKFYFNKIMELYSLYSSIQESNEKAVFRIKAVNILRDIKRQSKNYKNKCEELINRIYDDAFKNSNFPKAINSYVEYEQFKNEIKKNQRKYIFYKNFKKDFDFVENYIELFHLSEPFISYLTNIIKETDSRYFLTNKYITYYCKPLSHENHLIDVFDNDTVSKFMPRNNEHLKRLTKLIEALLDSKLPKLQYVGCRLIYQVRYSWHVNNNIKDENKEKILGEFNKICKLALTKYRIMLYNLHDEKFLEYIKDFSYSLSYQNFGPYTEDFSNLTSERFKEDANYVNTFEGLIENQRKQNSKIKKSQSKKSRLYKVVKYDFYRKDRTEENNFSLFSEKKYLNIHFSQIIGYKIFYQKGMFYFIKNEGDFQKYSLIKVDEKSGKASKIYSIDKPNGLGKHFLFDSYFAIISKDYITLISLDGKKVIKKKIFVNGAAGYFECSAIKENNKIYLYYSNPKIIGCYDIVKDDYIILYSQDQEKNNIFHNKKAPRQMLGFSEDKKRIIFSNRAENGYYFDIKNQIWIAIDKKKFRKKYNLTYGCFPRRSDNYVFLKPYSNYDKHKEQDKFIKFSFNLNRTKFFPIEGYKEGANFVQKMLYFGQNGTVILGLEDKILIGKLKSETNLLKLKSFVKRTYGDGFYINRCPVAH